jgi:hypothetical protein
MLLVGVLVCSAFNAAYSRAAGHGAIRTDPVPIENPHSRYTS